MLDNCLPHAQQPAFKHEIYMPPWYMFIAPGRTSVPAPPPQLPQIELSSANSAGGAWSHTNLLFTGTKASPSPASSSGSEDAAAADVAPKRRAPRKGTPPDRIPRPPNAFIIFRSELSKIIPDTVQNDQKRTSRSAGKIWASLSEEKRREYEVRAEIEKEKHRIRYPNYRFQPTARSKPIARRKVKGSTAKDKARDEGVAELFMAGKKGQALVEAVLQYDRANSTEAEAEAEAKRETAAADVRQRRPKRTAKPKPQPQPREIVLSSPSPLHVPDDRVWTPQTTPTALFPDPAIHSDLSSDLSALQSDWSQLSPEEYTRYSAEFFQLPTLTSGYAPVPAWVEPALEPTDDFLALYGNVSHLQF